MKQKKIIFIVIGCILVVLFFLLTFFLIKSYSKITKEMRMELSYDEVGSLGSQLYAVRKGIKIGYVDAGGKEVIPPKYTLSNTYSSLEYYQEKYGYMPFAENNKFGLIDKEGTIVLKPTYQFLQILSANSFLVTENNGHFLINKEGQKITETYANIEKIRYSTYLLAYQEDSVSILSSKGKVLWKKDINVYSMQSPPVSIMVDEDRHTGYFIIEENGKYTISLEYGEGLKKLSFALQSRPLWLYDNKVYSKEQNEIVMYHLNGKEIKRIPALLVGPFKEDVSLYVDGQKLGLYNIETGKQTNAIYEATDFKVLENGYVMVTNKKEDKTLYTLLNKKGKEVVAGQENKILDMIGNTYIVSLDANNRIYVKDKKGKTIKQYQSFAVLSENRYLVKEEKGFGVIDNTLKSVIPFQYDEVKYHNNIFYLKRGSTYKIVIDK
ncbi:MAG: WG repeat-containing protein [Bacilli bacterium]|nr:WG repeat-containing protein [Bacilli bacterium]